MVKFARLVLLILIGFILVNCQNKLPLSQPTFNINDSAWRSNNNINNITATATTPEYIFIGTNRGVFKVDKSGNNPTIIESLAEFKTRYMVYHPDDEIRLNDGYSYNFKKDILSGSFAPDNIKSAKLLDGYYLAQQFDNSILIFKKNDTLRFSDYPGPTFDFIVNDSNHIWIPGDLRKGISKLVKENGEVEFIPVGYDFRNYSVDDNDSIIYFINNEGRLEFNKRNHKTYFVRFKNGTYLNNDKKDILELNAEETPFFNYVSEELTEFTGSDFRTSYDKYLQINARFKTTGNKRVKDKLTELKTSLNDLFPFNFEEAKKLEPFCTDTIKDSVITIGLYKHLIRTALYEGKLREALHFDSTLINEYPYSRDSAHKSQIELIKKTEYYLSSLKGTLKNDELLWLRGKAYYDLFMIIGPRHNGIVSMSYPFSILREIRKNYPYSRYADNADYTMLRHIEDEIKGNKTLRDKVLKEYRALIEKYPDSELQPALRDRLARMLYEYIPADGNRFEYLKESLGLAEGIISNYPDYASLNNINELVSLIESAISMTLWEFNVYAKKKKLNPFEPVLLTFTMTNIDSIPKNLLIPDDKTIPAFTVKVSQYGLYADFLIKEINFQPDYRAVLTTKSDSLIAPGKYYSETWNITERALSSFSESAGKFVFNKPGRYKVTCRPIDDSYNAFIRPKVVWITIEENTKSGSPF